MTKWQIAYYLIVAKKEVDTLWYIAANQEKINIDIKYIVDIHRERFYLYAAAVVEKFTKSENGKSKKEVCLNDNIDKLFRYRDRHIAHKDDEYRHFEYFDYGSIIEIVKECITILKTVKDICQKILPDNITLDFVCYDKNLFRLMYNIPKDLEEKIKKDKNIEYKSRKEYSDDVIKNIFDNPELLYEFKDREKQYLELREGITIEERIQNLQHFCICGNTINKKDYWIEFDYSEYRRELMAIKLGYVDVFGRTTNKMLIDGSFDSYLLDSAKKYLVYNLHIDDELIREAIRNG